MTRDDIKRMAREVGMFWLDYGSVDGDSNMLERFAALVAEREREACAKVCESLSDSFLSSRYAAGQPMSSIRERFAAGRCAELIRARSEA